MVVEVRNRDVKLSPPKCLTEAIKAKRIQIDPMLHDIKGIDLSMVSQVVWHLEKSVTTGNFMLSFPVQSLPSCKFFMHALYTRLLVVDRVFLLRFLFNFSTSFL